MRGMDAKTGVGLQGMEHLRQSITDLLTTPVGTRVMRRDYGCDAWKFVDAPANPRTFAQIISSVAIALQRWEPRFRLDRCLITLVDNQGRVHLELDGELVLAGVSAKIEGIVL